MMQESVASAPQRKPNTLVIAVPVALALVLAVVFGLSLFNKTLGPVEGVNAPTFTIQTYDGDTFSLEKQRGKVVVLNFWASWCGPCRSEAPDLNAVWTEYKDRGVVFFGVGYLDNEGDARRFIKEFGIQYPTGSDNGTTISKAYRITGVPENYIVDKNGVLHKALPRPITARELREILDKLLAG